MKDNNFQLSLSTKFYFIPGKCCAKIIEKKKNKKEEEEEDGYCFWIKLVCLVFLLMA